MSAHSPTPLDAIVAEAERATHEHRYADAHHAVALARHAGLDVHTADTMEHRIRALELRAANQAVYAFAFGLAVASVYAFLFVMPNHGLTLFTGIVGLVAVPIAVGAFGAVGMEAIPLSSAGWACLGTFLFIGAELARARGQFTGDPSPAARFGVPGLVMIVFSLTAAVIAAVTHRILQRIRWSA